MEQSYFYFGASLHAKANKQLNNETVRTLWFGFCCQSGSLVLDETDEYCFLTGDMQIPKVPEGKEFVLSVTERGIALAAKDYGSLARGMMTLMLRIEAVELTAGQERFRIALCHLESKYTLRNRMIHFCVFPETTPAFLMKSIRLAGIMQYTHVVLEFWGMLRYDCLKELSWNVAYPKAFVRRIVKEIEELGMEAIPMMNHLGHAAACRDSGGKHVVLDQTPKLATLFTQDGWSWNVDNPKSVDLLRQIRQELYELFPNSRYIHLGFDEVYSYGKGEDNQKRMRGYLYRTLEEVKEEGRRPIIWGDMLLNAEAVGIPDAHGGADHGYFCSCDTPELAQKMIDAIPKDTIIADWHYDVHEWPLKTSIMLKNQGFAVLGAPWFDQENCQAHVQTAQANNLMGTILTTWHTLAQKMPSIVANALLCGAYQSPWSGPDNNRLATETATILRKAYFANGDYQQAGWTDGQIFLQANPMG